MNNESVIPDNNKITSVQDSPSSNDIKSQQEGLIVERIPIYEEEFDVSKELTKTQLHLEKRWIKSTKKIEIPINYEEMYMNGKEFDSYSHNEVVEIISKVKEKITEVLSPKQTEGDENQIQNREDGDEHHYPNDLDIKLQKDQSTASAKMSQSKYEYEYESQDSEKRPLSSISETDINSGQIQVSDINNNNLEEEQVIPLWGEQIIIDKKMVKLGEIVIKKSKFSEKRRLDIDVRKEKVTVKYPDDKKQQII